MAINLRYWGKTFHIKCRQTHGIEEINFRETYLEGFGNWGRSRRGSHADFHGFGEIGHIFHDKYIFNNKTHFSSWNLANILSEWLGNPGKGTLKTKNPKKFPEGARLLILLEACSLGARLGSRWEFILDPRLRRQEIHESEEKSSRLCLWKREIYGVEERSSKCEWR